MPKTIYWVDDARDPKDFLEKAKYDTVMWFKTAEDFEAAIERYELPDEVWFDHDLGEAKSGKDCADAFARGF